MLSILLASLLPGVFWLWYFNRYDVFDKEPVINLALSVAAGALAVVPALAWEAPFRMQLASSNALPAQLILSFLVVGFGEELFKLLAVLFTAANYSAFNEPMDGIIYAIASGIGFSIVENVFYISSFGLAVAPLRGTVSTLAHIAFSGLAGYYLGLAKFSAEPRSKLARGLLLAVFLHGTYDFLLMAKLVSPLVLIFMVLGLQFLLFKAIDRAVRLSPFR